jgi:hypothetical protein
MVELSLDAAGGRLSFNPYGARGRCRHGDGPVLQHRPDQLFDDKWSTYPGITRKFWSFSEAARENGASRNPVWNSLSDRGGSRLRPARTRWGLGFRTRLVACEAWTGDHPLPRVWLKVCTSELRCLRKDVRIPSTRPVNQKGWRLC